MRVALLSRAAHPLHPPGGLERAVYDLARHLQRRGVETVLFTRPATQPGAAFPGEVRALEYGPRRGRGHGRVFDRVLYYPRFAWRLGTAVAELVRAGAVDIVHAQGLTALGYGRMRAADASLRAPLVMNPQGMEEHKTVGLKRLALTRVRRLSRQAAGLCDRVIATDASTQGEVVRLLDVDAAKVSVVENAVDLEWLRGVTPAAPKAHADEAFPFLAGAFPVLLSVGRVEAYKGFADILGALQMLESRRALPARWAWVLVGEGTFHADLSKLFGASPHVHAVGRVADADLHALYERADVFVHATRYEGSSLVTLEAMAHGLAVVATRAGGIPDKIEDGSSGRLVDVGDAASLAAALEALIQDASLRTALGEAAAAVVRERFSWERAIDKTLALYSDLLAQDRA
jgi:glycosyltransferase involved in cell wall biosynthesis